MANITIRHGDSLDIVLGYTVNGETIYEGDCEATETTDYQLREDLTWEAYTIEPVDIEDGE